VEERLKQYKPIYGKCAHECEILQQMILIHAIMYVMTFGKGLTLRQYSPFLRDKKERARRIVDAAERNSVIEGLPRFGKERKEHFMKKLTKGA